LRRAALLAGAALLQGALAAEPGEETLEEIVVTAMRTSTPVREVARAVSVIDKSRIQAATQQLDLGEALVGTPGLYLQNRNNFAQDLRVSLRGFGARSSFGIRGIRIFVDDIPESLPDGQAQVDSIDIGATERIEVLRGPASSLYGNAAGGVIAITSELAGAAPFAEARVAFGEFGFRKLQLKARGETGPLAWLGSLNRHDLDGYRDHAAAKGEQASLRAAWQISASDRLLLAFNHTDQPLAQDAGGLTVAEAAAAPSAARDRNVLLNAGEALAQQRLGLVYRHTGGTDEWRLRGYHVRRDFDNRLPFRDGGAVTLDRRFYGGGAQYRVDDVLTDGLMLLSGVDVDRQDDDRRRYDNEEGGLGALVFDQAEEVTAAGAYLHGQYAFDRQWVASLGLRRDRLRFDVTDRFLADGDDSGEIAFSETSASAGLSYISGKVTVYAAFSSAFEAPTTTELASPEGGGFNEQLAAQVSRNFELGYRFATDRSLVELAVFHIDVDDELVPFELPAFPGRTFFRNAGRSERDGLELEVRWRAASDVQTGVTLTYSDFRFTEFVDEDGVDYAGNTLPGVPRWFGSAFVALNRDEGLFARAELLYSGTLYAADANDLRVDPYTVVNGRLGYRLDRGRFASELFLGLNNLFDAAYNDTIRINAFGGRYFEPAPGRNVYGGVRMRFE
jgi:iron complex outermembrane receptor protein